MIPWFELRQYIFLILTLIGQFFATLPDPSTIFSPNTHTSQNTMVERSSRLQTTGKLPLHRYELLDHENCGMGGMNDRIIGGKQAGLGQYPWLARLSDGSLMGADFPDHRNAWFKCGGALITTRYVLTAAHCTDKSKTGKGIVLVRLGEYNIHTNPDCVHKVCAPPHQDFGVEEVITHEHFVTEMKGFDISLIRLDGVAQLHEYVEPICLPYGSQLYDDLTTRNAEVAGFGVSDIHNLTNRTEVPLTVRVPILPLEECNVRFNYVVTVKKGQICAGGIEGKDSCRGDSGGPLMLPHMGKRGPPRYFCFGIVSYGDPKCGSNKPAVYTDVRDFMEWIIDNMEP